MYMLEHGTALCLKASCPSRSLQRATLLTVDELFAACSLWRHRGRGLLDRTHPITTFHESSFLKILLSLLKSGYIPTQSHHAHQKQNVLLKSYDYATHEEGKASVAY
jgi:hypothetical protein